MRSPYASSLSANARSIFRIAARASISCTASRLRAVSIARANGQSEQGVLITNRRQNHTTLFHTKAEA